MNWQSPTYILREENQPWQMSFNGYSILNNYHNNDAVNSYKYQPLKISHSIEEAMKPVKKWSKWDVVCNTHHKILSIKLHHAKTACLMWELYCKACSIVCIWCNSIQHEFVIWFISISPFANSDAWCIVGNMYKVTEDQQTFKIQLS